MQYHLKPSNINVVSNIYVRNDQPIELDEKFLHQVRGLNALNKLFPKGTNANGVLNRATLTPAQQDALANTAPCSATNNLLNEKTFGYVQTDEGIVWACRCENDDCAYQDECFATPYSKRIKRRIIRKTDLPIERNDSVKNQDFEYLGVENGAIDNISIFEEKVTPEKDTHDNADSLIENTEDYIKTDDQNLIIESPINEKILVNASPGTGKTYTAIKRLEYIIKNKLVEDYGNIVVICYTRVAVNVINTRITEGILKGELDQSAKNIHVRTADSFATAYLNKMEVEGYHELNYEQRIAKFNEIYNKEVLEKFEYIIIDEIQDFVNHRALMIANIISSVNCGYLLLGDSCQAIYDYSAKNKSNTKAPGFCMTSVEFYNLIHQMFLAESTKEGSTAQTKKYELTKNYRQASSDDSQTSELATISQKIREVILEGDLNITKNVIETELKPYELEPKTVDKSKPEINQTHKTAFLCRSNAQVEYVSSALHKKGISHELITNHDNMNVRYARWIARVFWDYCVNRISKEDFILRYVNRIGDDEDHASKLFNVLSNFINKIDPNEAEEQSTVDYIETDKLWDEMRQQTAINVPELLLEPRNNSIVVCTIHKAKGLEFDDVFLTKFNNAKLNSMEEARVIYVAMTRTKKSLKIINFTDKLKLTEDRTNNISRSISAYSNFNTLKVNGIAIGSISGDIDYESHLCGDLAKVVTLQQYLLSDVKPNDKIDLILENDRYSIYHVKAKLIKDRKNDICLGLISDNTQKHIQKILKKCPYRIRNLFIDDVITIPQHITSSNVPVQFKESKFSLGIKLSGFAKFDA